MHKFFWSLNFTAFFQEFLEYLIALRTLESLIKIKSYIFLTLALSQLLINFCYMNCGEVRSFVRIILWKCIFTRYLSICYPQLLLDILCVQLRSYQIIFFYLFFPSFFLFSLLLVIHSGLSVHVVVICVVYDSTQ